MTEFSLSRRIYQKRNKKSEYFSTGFTIIELLVVIVVIGILATLTLVAYTGINDRAVVATVKSDLETHAKLLGIDYFSSGETYPVTVFEANGGKGLRLSKDNTISNYVLNSSNNPSAYCLEETNPNGTIFYITSDNNVPTEGTCNDYTAPFIPAWFSTYTSSSTLPTPTDNAVSPSSSTTFTETWSATPGASGYLVQCNTDNATWGSGCQFETTNTSYTFSGSQGQKYYVRVQATGSGLTPSNFTDSATTTTPISTPAAPTYAGPSSFTNGVHYTLNYTSYCPSGTSLYNGNYTSQSWGGGYYYHSFGYTDWWSTGGSTSKNVKYWGRYQCKTTFVTSSVSPDSYNLVNVHP